MNQPKAKQLKKYLPLAVLPIVLIAVLFAWVNFSAGNITVVYSQDGVWDLADIDMDGTMVSLAGTVEYIPNALLTSEEFTARQNEAVIGTLPEYGYFTSRLRLYTRSDSWLSIGHSVLDRAVVVYVNGVHAINAGAVGTTPEAVTNTSSRIMFTATPDTESGIIEIIVQSSAFVRAGSRTGIIDWYVGDSYLHDMFQTVDRTQNTIMISFLLLSLLALVMHFNSRPKIRGNYISLLFAAYCFTWFVGAGVTGARPLGDWFSWLDWEAMHRMSFIVVHVTAGLLVAIINDLFPGIVQKYFRVGIYVIAAGFAISAIFIDVNLLRTVAGADGLSPFVYLAGNAYVLIRFAVKLRMLNRTQYIFLCGIALFLYITVRDIIWHLGGILLPPFGGDGLMVFHGFMVITAAVAALLMTLCAAIAVFITVRGEVEKAKEAERRLSEENAAFDRLSRLKSNFLADISHEMKTPLTLMGGFADLTRWQINEGATNDSTLENLTTIADEASRLAQLVNRLLDLSSAKDSSTRGVRVLVPDIISRMAALCQPILAANENSFESEIEKNCPPVQANPDMILQVLFNLVTNANRHTTAGAVKITARCAGDMVEFQVRDNGTGIPKELLPGIFKRGVSGDGGTGIGLAICKEAVEAGGGEIRIESGELRVENGRERKTGTIVSFTLPMWKEGDAHERENPVS